MIDLIIGMIIGMAASPIMMKIIKVVRQRRRVSKILHETPELQKGANCIKRIIIYLYHLDYDLTTLTNMRCSQFCVLAP